MNNLVSRIRIFLCLSCVCLIAGFFIAATSTTNVFAGIAVMVGGTGVFTVMAIIPAVKLFQLQNSEKENRIKKLEEEVELLKKK